MSRVSGMSLASSSLSSMPFVSMMFHSFESPILVTQTPLTQLIGGALICLQTFTSSGWWGRTHARAGQNSGARAKAWCLLIHADASLSLSLWGLTRGAVVAVVLLVAEYRSAHFDPSSTFMSLDTQYFELAAELVTSMGSGFERGVRPRTRYHLTR